ncbi:MAG TPA: AAA family ATPase [Archangium sp.]|uniref:AAA family ATPase n=1 Tax=Archangium sp. TaxID=1872627 RepID=UPI002E32E1A4|nr:AAA family ATPase [Archangium sp.]HEX5754591.1 AAA family ATPase [Archangium sp.]
MYITRLHVKNMKLMRDLVLDFTHEDKPRMWTVFVAENGACKTTLLQAIALAASGPDRANQLADVPSLPDVRRAGETVQVGADFEFGTRLEKWRLFPKSKVSVEGERAPRLRSVVRIEPEQSTFSGDSWFAPTGALESIREFTWHVVETRNALLGSYHELLEHLQLEVGELKGDDRASLSQMLDRVLAHRSPMIEARAKSFPGWFVAGYGTQRQLPVPLSVSELKDRILNRLEPLFGKAPLVGTGFANQFADTPRFEPFIAALEKVFVDNHLLPHVDAVELRGRGGVTQPGDLVRSHSFEFAFSGQKTKVPATWLSQGYQSTIAWIADLIGQMYLDIGEAVPLEDMEGMVLIDELDLHLHPTWQVRLVPVLKRVFPRMQFIVTTHSPMLLPALERHEIVMLRLNENGDVVAEAPPASPRLMTGSEIYSSFFNIQKLYPSDLGDELRRYTYLSSDPTRTDEEDAEMLRLQKKLTEAGLDLGLPPVPRDMP